MYIVNGLNHDLFDFHDYLIPVILAKENILFNFKWNMKI